MASFEPVSPPQLLGLADADGGLALSAAAGWNQTLDDWRLFLGHGHTLGCRDARGRLIATAAALPYDGGLGWISMVLVDSRFQHRGLATQLMKGCVGALRDAHVAPVLDATPAGSAVYRRMGFVPGFELDRWQGELGLPSTGPEPASVLNGLPLPQAGEGAIHAADSVAFASLDAAATGLGRRVVIDDFCARPTSKTWLAADGEGFVILRRGHRAWQLGPLIAADESSALSLLRQALAAAAGRVFLDVPRRWAALTAWLTECGFVRQRGFVRMASGAGPTVPDRVFVLAGPEFG